MKQMRSLFTVLLTIALLTTVCAVFAWAAPEGELPYMQQLGQDDYINVMFLTTDSYPEVCIGPNYFSGIYVSKYAEPNFVHFACPPNTYVADFDETSCSFIDMNYSRQYLFAVHEEAAFETFINEAENDEYIIADGSEGAAIYIDPERCQADALIAATDIGKSGKVQMRIYDDSLEGKNEQQIVDSLTALAKEEVALIQATMRVDRMEDYWTIGRYGGFKQICGEPNSGALIMTYTLPEGYFITGMESGEYSIATLEGSEGSALVAEIGFDTYTSVDYYLEEDPDNVTTMEIDGVEYRVYPYWYSDGAYVGAAYVDRFVSDGVGYGKDDTLRLCIEMDLDGDYRWTSVEEMKDDLAVLVSGIQLDFDQTIPDYRDAAPYGETAVEGAAVSAPVVAEEPAPEAEDEPAAPAQSGDDTWSCASCGAENKGGKFCANCGTPREEQPLVCSNCGYVVPEGETPKFCANCGNQF